MQKLNPFTPIKVFQVLEAVFQPLREIRNWGALQTRKFGKEVKNRAQSRRPLTSGIWLFLTIRFLAGVLTTVSMAGFFPAAYSQESTESKSIQDSRKVALQVSQDLRTQLIREMQLSGPLRSLVACKYTCPEILSMQSRKTGWRVAAVSLRPRNSALGMADAWEQKVIADFDRRVAKGEKGETLEFVEIVSEPQGKYFRYAKAMMVERLCLQCHGSGDQRPDSVKAQLAIDYPFDQAVDFRIGQVYGIVSIKRGI